MKKKVATPDTSQMGGRQERSVFVVVSDDITNDRRSLKVMKALEGYGRRVQYSVFECRLTAKTYGQLRQRLSRLISVKEDDVRFYQLCRSCQRSRAGLGQGKPQEPKSYEVV